MVSWLRCVAGLPFAPEAVFSAISSGSSDPSASDHQAGASPEKAVAGMAGLSVILKHDPKTGSGMERFFVSAERLQCPKMVPMMVLMD